MSDVTTPSEVETTSNPTRKRILQLIVGALALALGLYVGWLGMRLFAAPPEFNGMVIQSPEQLSDFTLTAHTGETVNLYDYRGQVVLLYYGYTFCPDICPATMAELKTARASLGNQADDVQVIMVTVDPERDTAEKLAEYMAFFDPTFLGLTGTDEEIMAATAPYGIFYQKQEVEGSSGYLMDHTAAVLVIDREGYLRMLYPFGVTGEDIGSDLEILVREGQGLFN
ncbi:MAG: SCO family protein [Ardenticatenaceae bacterium]|nr:SCO family protein [Ardenticatenaceae bacterium]